jgi:molybdate transport system ATP-binding protein
VSAGEVVRLSIRAGDVVIATAKPTGISVRSVLSGVVTDIEPVVDSAFAYVSVDVGGQKVKARLTRHAIADLGLQSGIEVFALIKAAALDRGF